MAAVTMKLEGIQALQKALEQAKEAATAHVVDVVFRTAFAMASRAKVLAPRDTGTLKDAIVSNVQQKSFHLHGGRLPDGRVLIEPRAYYWRFVEFGTVKMTARPFLRPAFDQEAALVEQRLVDVARRIERQASSGGRFV